MPVELNSTGSSHARSLINAGKVDRNSSWSISADDENALLGAGGDDWSNYASWHLGVDRSAAEKTKARYKYPFGKSGKVYRSALTAIRQRAAQQGATSIFNAAGSLLSLVDGGKGKSSEESAEFERRSARFEYRFTETATTPGTFEGYGAVFNNEDDYGDVIVPGAFTKTLAEHDAAGTMPKMLLNHGGMGSFFASPAPEDLLPIGKWSSVSEDTHGLQCKGRLISLDTEIGKRVYGAMKENALDGLSIGFRAKQFVRGTRENEPKRTLQQVHLLEISPVTFPANGSAKISSVKSAIDFTDRKGAEKVLHLLGLSQRDATIFIARVKALGQGNLASSDEQEEAVKALKRRASLFAR